MRPRHSILTILAVFVAVIPLSAQDREVFGNVGWGSLFRFEDQNFGEKPVIGGGVGIRLPYRLGLEAEVGHMPGLEPRSVPCSAIVTVPCEGSTQDGYRWATVVSGNALYHFSDSPRVQPYVIGGIGAMLLRAVRSTIFLGQGGATVSQSEETSSGLSISFGAGARIRAGRSISVRPEFRIYDSTALSRENLTLIRASIGVGYNW